MKLAYLLTALVALSLSACDQEVSPPPPTGGIGGSGAIIPPPIGGRGGTSGAGGLGGMAGAGGVAGAGGIGGMGGALCNLNTGGMGGFAGAGGFGGFIGMACIDPGDRQVIEMTEQNLRWHSARCATDTCFNLVGQDQLFVDCVTRCVQRAATPTEQLSDTCGCCYGRLARCAQINCNVACANTEEACTPPCRGEVLCGGIDYAACLDVLNDCTGRDSLDCPDP